MKLIPGMSKNIIGEKQFGHESWFGFFHMPIFGGLIVGFGELGDGKYNGIRLF